MWSWVIRTRSGATRGTGGSCKSWLAPGARATQLLTTPASTSARPCKAPSGFKSMPPPSALPNGDSQPSSLAVSRPATLAGADDLLLQAERYLVRCKLLSSGLYAHPSSSGGMAKPLLLCGTSGSGKTALAKEVAERAAMNRELLTGQ